MSGSLFRFILFTKVLLQSIFGIVLLCSLPVVSIVLYHEYGMYNIESFLSMMYEHAAVIWLVLIFYGISMIEFDSIILKQNITYPFARWKFAFERLIFSYIVFFIVMAIITIPFTLLFGSMVFKAMLYSIPIYLFFGGVIFISIIVVGHSLAGVLAGLFAYVFATLGAPLLGPDYQIVMLRYGSVSHFLSGEYGYAFAENSFYYVNRMPYIIMGIVLTFVSIIKFQRKPV